MFNKIVKISKRFMEYGAKLFGYKYLSFGWLFCRWPLILIFFMVFMGGFTIAPLPFDMVEITQSLNINSENPIIRNISSSLITAFAGIGFFFLSLGHWLGNLIPYNQQIGGFICSLFVYVVPIWAGLTMISAVYAGTSMEEK